MNAFTHSVLGSTGLPVYRLGLSASYRPGTATVCRAAELGVNFFFSFGFDTQMSAALPQLFRHGREKYLLATGAYNYIWGHGDIRKTLERRLRKFQTDYIDVFLFLGVMKEAELPPRVLDDMVRIRDEGRVRAIGISTHDRKLAGRLAHQGLLDVLMIRYNAAHRGAEQDVFPHLAQHNPGLVAYTATRWTHLLRRPRGYPADAPVPTAPMTYRFCLSSPAVHVCLSAPRSTRELEENVTGLERGPLSEDEMNLMREFGDRVHHTKRWFM
jgi:aryl-alcohol dehydrogenase-like predicted oxidoreductase